MHRFGLLVSVVVMVLVGTVTPTPAATVVAQEATPDAAAAIPPLLLAWAEAWSSGDPAQVAALYAENGVYEEIPSGVIARGPEEIEAFVADTMAAVSNIQITPRTGFQAEAWAVMEADYAGESEGTPFSIPFIVVFELEGDRIVRNADYFDLSALTAQLAAGGDAAATPAA